LAVLLAGCGTSAQGTRFTVHTVEAPPEDVTATARVIQERFDTWAPSRSSRIATRIEGNRIDFDFRGVTPTAFEIVYLGSTRGVFHLADPKAPTIAWISDLDFLSAKCVDGELGGRQIVRLVVDVKPEASTRLASLTRQNLGRPVFSYWDGKVIGESRINTEFGEHFEMTLRPDEHARLRCTILQTGRLPAAVDNYSFEATRIS
jgi:hypothetical protein